MTTIFFNDHQILFGEGTFDSGMFLLEKSDEARIDFTLSELVSEPSFQIKAEEIVKTRLKENGMTTDGVVILFSGELVHQKQFVEENLNSDAVPVRDLVELELTSAFGEYFSPERDSFYRVPEFFSSPQPHSLTLFTPKSVLSFASRLIKAADWQKVNVIPEPIALHSFYDSFPGKPDNFIILHALNDNLFGVYVYVSGQLSKFFPLPFEKFRANPEAAVHFLSTMLGFNFPDLAFSAAIIHSDTGIIQSISDQFSKFNISVIDSTELISMVQSPFENSAQLLRYIPLLGTFVE